MKLEQTLEEKSATVGRIVQIKKINRASAPKENSSVWLGWNEQEKGGVIKSVLTEEQAPVHAGILRPS